MSASRLKQRIELAGLSIGRGAAAGNLRVAGRLDLADLVRLGPMLARSGRAAGDAGVEASMTFWRDASGLVVVEGKAVGELPLLCQRCLEEFDWPLRHEFRLALQDGEAGTGNADELEILDGVGDSVVPADLIEDEILLALPLVAAHADVADCGALAEKLVPGKVAQKELDEKDEKARPFAGLASLLSDIEK